MASNFRSISDMIQSEDFYTISQVAVVSNTILSDNEDDANDYLEEDCIGEEEDDEEITHESSEFSPIPHEAYWPQLSAGKLFPNLELLRSKKGVLAQQDYVM